MIRGGIHVTRFMDARDTLYRAEDGKLHLNRDYFKMGLADEYILDFMDAFLKHGAQGADFNDLRDGNMKHSGLGMQHVELQGFKPENYKGFAKMLKATKKHPEAMMMFKLFQYVVGLDASYKHSARLREEYGSHAQDILAEETKPKAKKQVVVDFLDVDSDASDTEETENCPAPAASVLSNSDSAWDSSSVQQSRVANLADLDLEAIKAKLLQEVEEQKDGMVYADFYTHRYGQIFRVLQKAVKRKVMSLEQVQKGINELLDNKYKYQTMNYGLEDRAFKALEMMKEMVDHPDFLKQVIA